MNFSVKGFNIITLILLSFFATLHTKKQKRKKEKLTDIGRFVLNKKRI